MAHQAGACVSIFTPPNWILVHRRVTPCNKFTGYPFYTWVEKGTMRRGVSHNLHLPCGETIAWQAKRESAQRTPLAARCTARCNARCTARRTPHVKYTYLRATAHSPILRALPLIIKVPSTLSFKRASASSLLDKKTKTQHCLKKI